MLAVRLMMAMCFLFVWQLPSAQDQEVDMEAMMRWGSADVVGYHIVGVYQG